MQRNGPAPHDSPLAGLQVLDFSRLVPGPFCTSILAGLGAEVVKVEGPEGGDPLRGLPPLVDGIGALFLAFNRGKQSVTLNLKDQEGQAIAREMAARCDVVVEGFRPGVAARLGIDFDSLAAHNQNLIYCSISGFGQQGPLRDLPGHDLTYAAIGGLIDALYGDEPRVPGVQLVDAGVALLAAIQILASLAARATEPRFLDVSLLQGARALMPGAVIEALAGPSPAGRSLFDLLRGSERNNLYRCADGRWLAIAPLEEAFWQKLISTLRDEGELAAGETPTDEDLRAIFARRPAEEWFTGLGAAGIPCGPVRRVTEAAAEMTGLPWEPQDGDGPVPGLGEHTSLWLERLGYSTETETRLRAQAVV